MSAAVQGAEEPTAENLAPAQGFAITISQFPTAMPTGPAIGTMTRMAWTDFLNLLQRRREGEKDGVNFVPATFAVEADGQVRRLKLNVLTRTAIALDFETNKLTGEVPPPPSTAAARLEAKGWAGVIYTSHNHTPAAPRYRIVLPLSDEIAPALPAPEIAADELGLRGVLDESKITPASLFYLPSAAPGALAGHETVAIDGAPIDAAWMQEAAGALLAAREAEQAAERAKAMAEAAKRREERAKAGYDPNDSLIERIRDRLDLAAELVHHGYIQKGDRYLYEGSETGVPGVFIMVGSDGVERVFSHHSGDPLAAANLPRWCRTKAIDVVDVAVILDYAGDLKKGLYGLAKRFGIETPRPGAKPSTCQSDKSQKSTAQSARLLESTCEIRKLTETVGDDDKERPADTSDPEPRPTGFTDDALAQRFTYHYATALRHVAGWGRWLEWNGSVWKADDTHKVFDLSRRVCRVAAAECNNVKVSAIVASAKTVAAIERLAKADRKHAATVDQWDADPWLLNTPGGVVDLRTGKMRKHRSTDYMTKSTAVAPGGECPQFLAFLDRVTGGDGELQKYIQRTIGYALSGSIREHALFFCYGTGANGKGVLLNTVTGIMADYAVVASIDVFTASQSDRHPTDLAMLRGARLVTAQETEEGRRWAESRIKAMTGGDPITARFMRQDFFTFEPRFKLVIAGNHRPGLRNIDEAIRRRFNLVPFAVKIPPAERDKGLPEKLKKEWPGILKWAIQGCLDWQNMGLKPPKAVTAATDEYLDQEDALGLWIGECCKTGKDLQSRVSDLFPSWRSWADAAGEFCGSQKRFSQAMVTRGFVSARVGQNYAAFDGIGLNPPETPPENDGTDCPF